MMAAERRFNQLLLEAVDEGLSSLGESAKQAIYYHLEEDFNITRQEIPQKIEGFTAAIEHIFKSGAPHIKILMMKRLHQKAGGGLHWSQEKELTFVEYVAAVRRNFVERRQEDILVALMDRRERVVEGGIDHGSGCDFVGCGV